MLAYFNNIPDNFLIILCIIIITVIILINEFKPKLEHATNTDSKSDSFDALTVKNLTVTGEINHTGSKSAINNLSSNKITCDGVVVAPNNGPAFTDEVIDTINSIVAGTVSIKNLDVSGNISYKGTLSGPSVKTDSISSNQNKHIFVTDNVHFLGKENYFTGGPVLVAKNKINDVTTFNGTNDVNKYCEYKEPVYNGDSPSFFNITCENDITGVNNFSCNSITTNNFTYKNSDNSTLKFAPTTKDIEVNNKKTNFKYFGY